MGKLGRKPANKEQRDEQLRQVSYDAKDWLGRQRRRKTLKDQRRRSWRSSVAPKGQQPLPRLRNFKRRVCEGSLTYEDARATLRAWEEAGRAKPELASWLERRRHRQVGEVLERTTQLD